MMNIFDVLGYSTRKVYPTSSITNVGPFALIKQDSLFSNIYFGDININQVYYGSVAVTAIYYGSQRVL